MDLAVDPESLRAEASRHLCCAQHVVDVRQQALARLGSAVAALPGTDAGAALTAWSSQLSATLEALAARHADTGRALATAADLYAAADAALAAAHRGVLDERRAPHS